MTRENLLDSSRGPWGIIPLSKLPEPSDSANPERLKGIASWIFCGIFCLSTFLLLTCWCGEHRKSVRCPLKNKIAEGAEATLSVPCHTALRQSLSFPWMLLLPFLLLSHGSLRDDCISLRFSACGCESSLSSGSAQLSSQRSFCAPPLILQVL